MVLTDSRNALSAHTSLILAVCHAPCACVCCVVHVRGVENEGKRLHGAACGRYVPACACPSVCVRALSQINRGSRHYIEGMYVRVRALILRWTLKCTKITSQNEKQKNYESTEWQWKVLTTHNLMPVPLGSQSQAPIHRNSEISLLFCCFFRSCSVRFRNV